MRGGDRGHQVPEAGRGRDIPGILAGTADLGLQKKIEGGITNEEIMSMRGIIDEKSEIDVMIMGIEETIVGMAGAFTGRGRTIEREKGQSMTIKGVLIDLEMKDLNIQSENLMEN